MPNPQIEVEEAQRHAFAGEETRINRQAVQTDLFAKPKSAKEQIYDFIKSAGRRRTHEVIEFGTSIFCNKADRWARELAQEGRIWRMRKDLREMFFPGKEGVWSTYEADK